MLKKFSNARVARLYILDYGLFRVHSNGRVIGITGSLIETNDGRYILVDTGFPPKYLEDRDGSAREDRLDEFGTILELGPGNLPAGQIARIGLGPGDLGLQILTPSHIDHVGRIARWTARCTGMVAIPSPGPWSRSSSKCAATSRSCPA